MAAITEVAIFFVHMMGMMLMRPTLSELFDNGSLSNGIG